MVECFSCGQNTVDPSEEPRYDVMNPEYDPNTQPMSSVGPYCKVCWVDTYTYKLINP